MSALLLLKPTGVSGLVVDVPRIDQPTLAFSPTISLSTVQVSRIDNATIAFEPQVFLASLPPPPPEGEPGRALIGSASLAGAARIGTMRLGSASSGTPRV